MKNNMKTALVTGAAHRIGAAIANKLHEHGYHVLIHYCQSAKAAELLAQQLNERRPSSAHCLQADLGSVTSVQQLAANSLHQAEQWQAPLQVLINNASSFYPTSMGSITETDWDNLLGSNLKGAFFLSQSLQETLQEQLGCIVNMVDIYAERPLADHPVYSIAKAGVAMMTKALAKELAPNVRVNGIAPGAILWPEQSTSAQQQATLQRIPLKKTGSCDDIANTMLFLVEQAHYISGQIIAVDGGRGIEI